MVIRLVILNSIYSWAGTTGSFGRLKYNQRLKISISILQVACCSLITQQSMHVKRHHVLGVRIGLLISTVMMILHYTALLVSNDMLLLVYTVEQLCQATRCSLGVNVLT